MGGRGSCRKRVHNRGHASHVRLKGKLHADDSRRRNQHILLVAVKRVGDKGAGPLGTPQAGLSRSGVGVAGVEHHGTRVPRGGARTAHLHRRGAEAVLGERRRADACLVGYDKRHVLALGIPTKSCRYTGRTHAYGGTDATLAGGKSKRLRCVILCGDGKGLVVGHGRSFWTGTRRMRAQSGRCG
jgi:hypothetical protein